MGSHRKWVEEGTSDSVPWQEFGVRPWSESTAPVAVPPLRAAAGTCLMMVGPRPGAARRSEACEAAGSLGGPGVDEQGWGESCDVN